MLVAKKYPTLAYKSSIYPPDVEQVMSLVSAEKVLDVEDEWFP